MSPLENQVARAPKIWNHLPLPYLLIWWKCMTLEDRIKGVIISIGPNIVSPNIRRLLNCHTSMPIHCNRHRAHPGTTIGCNLGAHHIPIAKDIRRRLRIIAMVVNPTGLRPYLPITENTTSTTRDTVWIIGSTTLLIRGCPLLVLMVIHRFPFHQDQHHRVLLRCLSTTTANIIIGHTGRRLSRYHHLAMCMAPHHHQ